MGVMMTVKLLPISTILATSALALGYGLNDSWAWTVCVVALGFLWLLGQRCGWGWTASMGLTLFVGIAAVGLWLDAGAGWMLIGVVAALSAWDLDHFVQRSSGVGRDRLRVAGARELERRHVQRLLVVDGLGLLLGAVALGIEVEFGFGVALFLGLLAVLGLSRAIGFLRRESD